MSLNAESCGVGMTTVNRWIASYKQGGLDGVIERGTDRNHDHVFHVFAQQRPDLASAWRAQDS